MLSSYLVAKLADKIIDNTDFTVTVPYISLHSASPGTTGANEITAGVEGGSYSRQAASSWDSNLPRTNSTAITWSNTPYTAVTHFGIWDAVSSGNFLMGGTLIIPRTLFLGETAKFSAGHFTVNCELRVSSYFQPKILDKVLKNTDFTVTNAYMSVHTADPGLTGTGEVLPPISGVRGQISGQGTLQTPSLSVNTWTVEWVSVTGTAAWDDMPDNVYSYVGLWDASSGGNFLMGGALSSPVTTTAGNSEMVIDVGDSAFFKFTQAA